MDHELVKVAKVNALEPTVRREVESAMEGGNPFPEPSESLGIYGLVGETDYRVKGREEGCICFLICNKNMVMHTS